MGRSSLIKSPVNSHRGFCARGQHFRPHREGRKDILAQEQCGWGRAGAARSKWEWAACPVPWNTRPWGHATKGQGLPRGWAMPCDPSRIRTHSSGATSKRAEPGSCCSCAAEPADGNLGPSMATGSRGCGTMWPGALDTPAVGHPVAASGLQHGHPHVLSVGDTPLLASGTWGTVA